MWNQELQRTLEVELRTQRDHCQSFRRQSHQLDLTFDFVGVGARAGAGTTAVAPPSRTRLSPSRSWNSGLKLRLKPGPVKDATLQR